MGTPLRTLIVEDSDDDATLLVRELTRAGYDIDFERVDTPEGLAEALERGGWDLVCADYTMPNFLGTTALSMVRDREHDLPFIFVSGTIGEDVAVEAMKAGANDYVIKGNLKRFVPAVARELRDAGVRKERARLETELRQAQRLESVGRMASGLAHDFNNLLTVIGGYAQMLRLDTDLERRYAEDIAEISRAVERGGALTRQLLAFSRQQILELRVLDPNAVVTDMEQMLARLFGKEIEFVTRLSPDLGHVRADVGELHQVLVNLAVNARDAMPDGGRLVIETANVELGEDEVWAEAEPGDYVALVVRDTGVGMDAETRAHIFDPFFTTKGPGEGTGLGLPTAYGIVKQSGGHIRVSSAPGEGTTFTIYLPRTDEPIEARPSGEEDGPLPTGTEVVLVVEDEAPVRQLVERILADRGYTVLAATRAAEALRWLRLRDHRIRLVLTDARMPDMSGYELAERARSLRPGIRVLCMSGRSETDRSSGGVPDDEVAILRKPFTSTELAREVRRLLDGDA